MSEESIALSLRAVFELLAVPGGREAYEVRFEEACFAGVLGVGAVEVFKGASQGFADGPDAVGGIDLEALFSLSSGQESPRLAA